MEGSNPDQLTRWTEVLIALMTALANYNVPTNGKLANNNRNVKSLVVNLLTLIQYQVKGFIAPQK